MEYLFYGSENANVTAVSQEYPGIRTPLDLYDVLSGVWCEYTCAPRLRLNYPLKHVGYLRAASSGPLDFRKSHLGTVLDHILPGAGYFRRKGLRHPASGRHIPLL